MLQEINSNERLIVPRWRNFQLARLTGEIKPLKVAETPKVFNAESFSKKELEWNENRSLPYAIELVGTASILNNYNESIISAAEYLFKHREKVSNELFDITTNILNKKAILEIEDNALTKDETHKKIQSLKKYLSNYPKNPIAWSDISFYYASINELDKSKKAIIIAQALSGENRFILRSYAKYFIHIGEPDRALSIIRKTALSKIDPWITATEISLSSLVKQSSKRIKEGFSLANEQIAPYNLAELLGTLGTLEFDNGNKKNAKRLFERAIVDPNENTVAQVEWIHDKVGFNFDRNKIHTPFLFETDANLSLKIGRYKEALDFAKKWQAYQPISVEPAILGSYIAAVGLLDDLTAINIIQKVINAVPESFTLNNNYAFSLANLNKINEAEEALKKVNFENLSNYDKGVLCATTGLIQFRKKRIDDGRLLYKKSIEIFKNLGRERGLASAYLFFGREEYLYDSKSGLSKRLIRKAYEISKRNNYQDVINYIKNMKAFKKSFKMNFT